MLNNYSISLPTFRFNICRESVQETREICQLLMHQVFHPEIQKKDKDLLTMSHYLIKGVWAIAPYLQFKSVMCVLDNITRKDYENMSKPVYYQLNWFQRLHYWLFVNYVFLLQFSWFKKQVNLQLVIGFWFMKWFPFLGYYYYGVKRGTVDIGI